MSDITSKFTPGGVIGSSIKKIIKNKKDKESRNPDPKTPKMDSDKKEDNTFSKEKINRLFEGKKNKKVTKTAKNLQELDPAKPGIDKPTGKIQAFKGGGIALRGFGRAFKKGRKI